MVTFAFSKNSNYKRLKRGRLEQPVVLHDGTFLATLLAMLKTTILCNLLQAYYTVKFGTGTCNNVKEIVAIMVGSPLHEPMLQLQAKKVARAGC